MGESPSRSRPPIYRATKIALIYLLVSSLWIFISDAILNNLDLPQSTTSTIELIKGWAFVIISAMFFFLYLKKFGTDIYSETIERKERNTENKNYGIIEKRKDWFDPVIIIGIFIFTFGLFLFLIYLNSIKIYKVELDIDSKSAVENIHFTLHGNEEYLKMLAEEYADEKFSEDIFLSRTTDYVKDHAELINITWVDSSFRIKTAAPKIPNKQIIGLKLSLPEPKQAANQAKRLREPIYTRPFEAIQGKASFELWVPIYDGDKFLGLFAGVYSCNQLIKHVIPNQVTANNHVLLYNSSGGLLGESIQIKKADKNFIKALSFPQLVDTEKKY